MKSRGFKRNNPQSEPSKTNDKNKGEENEIRFDCNKCDFIGVNEEQLRIHFRFRHNVQESRTTDNEEFNCQECDFQGSTEVQLRKHFNIKHTVKGNYGGIKCHNCHEEFSEKWSLMQHRKTNHSTTVRTCRNFETGNCVYTAESCWWAHAHGIRNNFNNSNVQCFICTKTFESKSDMMIHRKSTHSAIIKQCTTYVQGTCQFQENYCWYNHEKQTNGRDTVSEEDVNDEDDTPSVFQEAVNNPKPPSTSGRKSQ